MLKVAILDDYQNVSQQFVDLEKLSGKYEFKIFSEPFVDEADILDQLADFEALLIMRERTPMTKNIIDNLTKLKFIITSGSRNKSIDLFLVPLVMINFNLLKLSIKFLVIGVLSRIINSASKSANCSIASDSSKNGLLKILNSYFPDNFSRSTNCCETFW